MKCVLKNGGIVLADEKWLQEDTVWSYRIKKLLRSKKFDDYEREYNNQRLYNKWYMEKYEISKLVH